MKVSILNTGFWIPEVFTIIGLQEGRLVVNDRLPDTSGGRLGEWKRDLEGGSL